LTPTEKSQNAKEKFHDLLQASRRRHKEENARLEDNRANNTDTTKARDLKTLALAEKITIDRSRQVQARDLFLLDLPHTSGNRITGHVEVFFRDKAGGDPGDILVCETDDLKPFLLFPPIPKENISARRGDKPGQLVVMLRGQKEEQWNEVLTLDAEEPEAAAEWVEMLGTEPVPPSIRSDAEFTDHVTSVVSSTPNNKGDFYMSGALDTDNLQIPIGEKMRRDAEESATPRDRRRVSRRTPPIDLPEPIVEESVVDEEVRDLNDAMNKAGSLAAPKRPRAARYHGKPSSPRPTTPQGQTPSTPGSQQTTPKQSDSQRPTSSPNAAPDMPHIPKVRSSSTPTTPEGPKSTPLKESMRPDLDTVKQRSQSAISTRDDGAPPPPAHKLPLGPNTLKKAPPVLDPPTSRSQNRRSSSPLKHEYQPSVESGASDSSEESDSEGSDPYSSSEDDELEIPGVPATVSVYPQRLSPKGSIYSLQNSTIAPSQSASQAPYNGPGLTSPESVEKYTVVGCSYWNDKGYWVDLYPDPCSLHIGPGWLKVFELATPEPSKCEKPLIVQVLTPIVTLVSHTLDIQVRSPLTADSKLHCKSAHIRYRMLTPADTSRIYNALKESRMRNMFYNAMQEERRVSGFGSNAYEAAIKGKGRNFLGLRRKQSYRATARAPSEMASESARSSASAMSALRNRLSGSSIFNIKKSSVDIAGSGDNSGPTSSYSSASGMTPPRTPTSFFSSSNAQTVDLGSENIKIRLYERVRHDWDDKKYAFLTVTPPDGRRQRSTLHNGLEKRILVTLRPHGHKDGPGKVIIDEVLGSRCFQQLGIKGVMCTIWQDIRGPNGELGMIGATGGVSGRQQKWLFQAKMGAHASQILGLVTEGGVS
jgi:hypothetical protein